MRIILLTALSIGGVAVFCLAIGLLIHLLLIKTAWKAILPSRFFSYSPNEYYSHSLKFK